MAKYDNSSVRLEYSIGELKDSAAARRHSVLLTAAPQIAESYERLRELSLQGLQDVPEDVRAEALDLYRSVIADGRFVDLLRDDPGAAAERLGIEVSPAVIDVIGRISNHLGGPVEGPVEAVVAVLVVIALAPKIPADGIVIDDSVVVRGRL